MSNKKNVPNEDGFESALTKLEQIVSKLESGSLELDETLKEFEKGVALYTHCSQLLSTAEKKISILTESLSEVSYKEKESLK